MDFEKELGLLRRVIDSLDCDSICDQVVIGSMNAVMMYFVKNLENYNIDAIYGRQIMKCMTDALQKNADDMRPYTTASANDENN